VILLELTFVTIEKESVGIIVNEKYGIGRRTVSLFYDTVLIIEEI